MYILKLIKFNEKDEDILVSDDKDRIIEYLHNLGFKYIENCGLWYKEVEETIVRNYKINKIDKI